MAHLWCRIGAKDPIRIVLTHAEISVLWPYNPRLYISLYIDFFWPTPFPFMVYKWGGIVNENRFQNGLTHIEFSMISTERHAWKSRSGLTFFDRSFCLFWETRVGVLGPKTALENISHSQRKVVRQEGYFSTYFRIVPVSLCESAPKEVCYPDTTLLVSHKRKKNRSKKVKPCRVFCELPQLVPPEISWCVDFFWPVSFPYMAHLRFHIGAKDPIRIVLTPAEISTRDRMDPGSEISPCVDFFWPILFPFMLHLWGGIGDANRFRNGLTHIEFSVNRRGIRTWKSRYGLTFFDWSYCLFWETSRGVSGKKTFFGTDSHPLTGTMRKYAE
jgi:hypothetical protein